MAASLTLLAGCGEVIHASPTETSASVSPSASASEAAPGNDLSVTEGTHWVTLCGGLSQDLIDNFDLLSQSQVDYFRHEFNSPAGQGSAFVQGTCDELISALGNAGAAQ
jgi:hypothetical protein